jgi:RNA polymerase sigma-70 factor (ECF subfamily)
MSDATDNESIRLVARWREGDQRAATELFQRYTERLIALAHSRMATKLAARVDPEDVIQSVYGSFFAAASAGRIVIERSGDLWRLLVAITLHKLRRQREHHTADKRSVAAEQDLAGDDSFYGIPATLLARDPSPVEAVTLAETLESIMRGLDPVQRRIVDLRLQGHSHAEIVAETHRSRATVQRVLDLVKQQAGEVMLRVREKGQS